MGQATKLNGSKNYIASGAELDQVCGVTNVSLKIKYNKLWGMHQLSHGDQRWCAI